MSGNGSLAESAELIIPTLEGQLFLVRKAIKLLNRSHWIKYSARKEFPDGTVGYCLIGAIQEIIWDKRRHGDGYDHLSPLNWGINQLMTLLDQKTKEITNGHYSDCIAYNDLFAREKQDILDLLTAAEDVLERQVNAG